MAQAEIFLHISYSYVQWIPFHNDQVGHFDEGVKMSPSNAMNDAHCQLVTSVQ